MRRERKWERKRERSLQLYATAARFPILFPEQCSVLSFLCICSIPPIMLPGVPYIASTLRKILFCSLNSAHLEYRTCTDSTKSLLFWKENLFNCVGNIRAHNNFIFHFQFMQLRADARSTNKWIDKWSIK